MKGLFTRGRIRAAVGLIAAYAMALQTLFAAFAPLSANAQTADFARLGVICFGSGSTGAAGNDGTPDGRHSGNFHCVLCGSVLSDAALEPSGSARPVVWTERSASYAPAQAGAPTAQSPPRDGPSRAPPLTV